MEEAGRRAGCWKQGLRAIFPVSPFPGGGRKPGRASSRPCCLRELDFMSQEPKACSLPSFLLLTQVSNNFPSFFLESCSPPLILAQRGSWQDGGSPPEDLMVLAEPPSPSRGRYCPSECMLPAHFFPVVAENASCGARRGGVLSGWAGPSAVSGEWGRVFEVHGKIQDKVCWQSSSSSSSESFSLTHISPLVS